MSQKYAVIVDPYSTGVLLAPSLAKRGYKSIAVQSSRDLVQSLLKTYRPDDFIDHIDYNQNIDDLLSRLSQYAVAAVLPGNESSVELTDLLAEKLGLSGNGTAQTRARRNKYAMIECLTAAGLNAARQTLTNQLEEALDWVRQWGEWPVVLKPLDSASTDHVTVCHNEADVIRSFHGILTSCNLAGHRNEQVLIQSYLDGMEYVVNTVSRDGRHYICDILESRKRTLNGSELIYDYYRLMPPKGEIQDALSAYIVKVLDCLGIRYGGGHAEIRMTRNGPALVEIGARGMGPLKSTTTMAAGTGHDMADLIVDVLDDGREFDRLYGKPYGFAKHAMVLYLSSTVSGTVTAIPLQEKLHNLDSLVGADFMVKPGDQIRPTDDLTSILAKLYLVHEDGAQIDQDVATLRDLESRYQPLVA